MCVLQPFAPVNIDRAELSFSLMRNVNIASTNQHAKRKYFIFLNHGDYNSNIRIEKIGLEFQMEQGAIVLRRMMIGEQE